MTKAFGRLTASSLVTSVCRFAGTAPGAELNIDRTWLNRPHVKRRNPGPDGTKQVLRTLGVSLVWNAKSPIGKGVETLEIDPAYELAGSKR